MTVVECEAIKTWRATHFNARCYDNFMSSKTYIYVVLGSVEERIELKQIKTKQNLAGFVALNAKYYMDD